MAAQEPDEDGSGPSPLPPAPPPLAVRRPGAEGSLGVRRVPGRPSRDLLDARLAAARERRRGALAAAAAAPVVDRPGPSEPSGEPEVVRPRSGADPSLHAARHRRPPAPHTRGRHRSAASARRRLALVVTCLVVCCAAAVVVLAA